MLLKPPINVYAALPDGTATHIGFITVRTCGGPLWIPNREQWSSSILLTLGTICVGRNVYLGYILHGLERFDDLCQSPCFRPSADAAFAIELLKLEQACPVNSANTSTTKSARSPS